jgi:uncharacterized protein YndB with AHSA1/START domain
MRTLLVVIAAIVAAVVLSVVAVLVIAVSKPDTLTVQRSIDIDAPPQAIYVLVDDFHNWKTWAPQDRGDATMTRTFTGPSSGAGAVSQWSGNGSAGAGRMVIADATAPERVVVTVDWTAPMRAHNARHLEHARHQSVPRKSDERLRRYEPHDGRPLRSWPRQSQVRCRK